MTDSTTALAGFEPTEFSHDGITRTVYRGGSGPGVVVMPEMPGLTPKVAEFARRLIAEGFTVAVPSLFGTPGREPSTPYILNSMVRGCVAKEFSNWAMSSTSPITAWLRALAADLHDRAGGPGVGAVGMCFTGGFALGMMVDDRMLAPVLSQPSLPFAFGAKRKRDLGISDADLAAVKERTKAGACVLGLRFTNDFAVPEERFTRLREELGEGFIAVEIDSSPGNEHGIPKAAHSVLTEHLQEEPGHPTADALATVITFLRERLTPAP